jgi:DNA-binding response OmpR family regulator
MSQHPAATHAKSVLIVDDDLGTRETFQRALTMTGEYSVETAASGREGLSLARERDFDLLLLDLQLPDVSGTTLLRALADDGRSLPTILVSAFLDVATTVQAMRLGACDVLEKPIDVDELLQVVRDATSSASPHPPVAPGDRFSREPGSAAERWASHVVKACDSERDLRTLQQWSRFVGVSYSSLRVSCRLVGVSPHDARDFMRMLRAILLSRRKRTPPELLLDVGDRRTLDALLRSAGLGPPGSNPDVTLEHFLAAQQFIPGGNAALRLVEKFLTRRKIPPASADAP